MTRAPPHDSSRTLAAAMTRASTVTHVADDRPEHPHDPSRPLDRSASRVRHRSPPASPLRKRCREYQPSGRGEVSSSSPFGISPLHPPFERSDSAYLDASGITPIQSHKEKENIDGNMEVSQGVEWSQSPCYDSLVDDFVGAAYEGCEESMQSASYLGPEETGRKRWKLAELALRRYNKVKTNKIKYSLVEAVSGGDILEWSELYAHLNFYAKAKKKDSEKKLIFAELRHVGLRPYAMALTCFHVLDGKEQFLGRRHDVRSSERTEDDDMDQDMDHCYACSDRVRHPIGSKYLAGHFVAKSFYFDD